MVSFLPIFPGAPNSDHQLQPPVALCSLKRSHNFYLYVRLSAIPSTCITLLHLCWSRFHAKFFFSNPAISLKNYIIYKLPGGAEHHRGHGRCSQHSHSILTQNTYIFYTAALPGFSAVPREKEDHHPVHSRPTHTY